MWLTEDTHCSSESTVVPQPRPPHKTSSTEEKVKSEREEEKGAVLTGEAGPGRLAGGAAGARHPEQLILRVWSNAFSEISIKN